MKFIDKAREIADNLDGQWVVQPPQHENSSYYVLSRQDGLTFGLYFDGWQNKGRVEVHTHLPKDCNGHQYCLKYGDNYRITLNYSRPVSTLAKEITRRFISLYEPKYIEAVEWVKKQNQQASWLADVTKLVVSGMSGNVTTHTQNGNSETVIHTGYYDNYGVTAKVSSYRPTVELTLQAVDLETAMEIIALMETARRK